jgi:hypothetical protein
MTNQTQLNERKLDRKEASAFLASRGYSVSTTTLDKYACLGGGPVYEKFGRRPLYTESGLLAWVASKTSAPQRHTSETEQDAASNTIRRHGDTVAAPMRLSDLLPRKQNQ